jgi:hypothetical protein
MNEGNMYFLKFSRTFKRPRLNEPYRASAGLCLIAMPKFNKYITLEYIISLVTSFSLIHYIKSIFHTLDFFQKN